jgi:hypothetical protein
MVSFIGLAKTSYTAGTLCDIGLKKSAIKHTWQFKKDGII